MGSVVIGSLAFSLGGAFMKASHGFTRLVPSLIVGLSFVLGSAMLARAAMHHALSTTLVVGLGIEAIGAVALGVILLGERLSFGQLGGVSLVVLGVAVLRI